MNIMVFALICIGCAVVLSAMAAVIAARVTVRILMGKRRRKAAGDCHTSVRAGSQ